MLGAVGGAAAAWFLASGDEPRWKAAGVDAIEATRAQPEGATRGDGASAAPLEAAPAAAPPPALVMPAATGSPATAPATVPSAAAAPAAPPEAIDWERIPFDEAAGESLGDVETRRAFSLALREKRVLGRCVQGWRAPAGVRKVDMQVELRVRSEEEALLVEDAIVRTTSVEDPGLVACVQVGLRGRRVPVAGVTSGQAFRLSWDLRQYL